MNDRSGNRVFPPLHNLTWRRQQIFRIFLTMLRQLVCFTLHRVKVITMKNNELHYSEQDLAEFRTLIFYKQKTS